MLSLPGLHDFIAAKAVEHFKVGATLLDLAAATGSMSLRMQDLGFKVTATDYVPENFKLDSVPFKQADLNDDFSSAYSQRFQAIIASEIIEHLENPRHFARECFKLQGWKNQATLTKLMPVFLVPGMVYGKEQGLRGLTEAFLG
jgi:2-polyprenyl-3-methyl-5-hydroxy-6-metoxy-1,4-benzoquinol methylase